MPDGNHSVRHLSVLSYVIIDCLLVLILLTDLLHFHGTDF